ncbi:MAG: tail fiber domain-containing protein, partial [Candidatus Aenigmarchaeota archaeon]|nr:tail fiber domain-containing protein [Candidatus Aenigmarchaeota archaeon]
SLNYNDNLIGWSNLTAYPAACPAGQFITALGDSITCQAPASANSGWVMDGTSLYNDTANVKVGIGTSSPTAKLDVVGTVNATNFYDRDDSQYYLDPSATSVVNNLQIASGVLTGANNEQIEIGATNDVIRFIAGGQERMRISNDKVGIGTSSPTAKLEIQGTGVGGLSLNVTNDFFVNDTTGNVGIGIINPGQKLDVSGNIRSNGEIISTLGSGSAQFRSIAGNYGFMIRNDGSNTYFLLTNSGDQYGTWNTLRPFRVSDSSGDVSLGNDVLYVQHGGNVGIGTSNPNDKLHIAGLTNGQGITIDETDWTKKVRIFFREGGSTSYGGIVGYDAGSDVLYLNTLNNNIENNGIAITRSTGNVGIGTSSPTAKLDVVGTVNATNFYDRDNSQYYLDPSATSVVNNLQIASGVLTGANSEQIEIGATNDVIRFIAGGQESMRISNGNVGIGTSDTTHKLNVNNVIQAFNNNDQFLTLYSGPDIRTIIFDDSDSLNFGKWNSRSGGGYTNLMKLTNTGYLGIGTADPQAPLHIIGSPYKAIKIKSSTWPSEYWEIGHNAGSTVDYGLYFVRGADTFLVLGNNATGSSYIKGPLGVSVWPSYTLDVGGQAHASSFPTSSDIRLKENITNITNALEKVMKMRGVYFDWNQKYKDMGRATGHREVGVIGQEIEQIIPELVTHWGEENYTAVDYSRLTAVLIEAIKEQQQEIERLNQTNNNLINEINQIKQFLCAKNYTEFC